MRVFILGILAFMCLSQTQAATDPRELILMIYSSAKGHSLGLGTYVASFRLPSYGTEPECETAGDAALKTFQAQVLENGARLLPAYVCQKY